MSTVVKFVLTVFLSVTVTTILAQDPKPAKAKPIAVQKFKPPKLTSMLGIRTDSAWVYVEEAVQLVKLPLRITDDKKMVYTISSYKLAYRRVGVTEDEETGKVTPITSNVSGLFRETPLPVKWTKILTEQMRPGEELYFFDIVVKDAQGRLMFAPELRIKIKK